MITRSQASSAKETILSRITDKDNVSVGLSKEGTDYCVKLSCQKQPAKKTLAKWTKDITVKVIVALIGEVVALPAKKKVVKKAAKKATKKTA